MRGRGKKANRKGMVGGVLSRKVEITSNNAVSLVLDSTAFAVWLALCGRRGYDNKYTKLGWLPDVGKVRLSEFDSRPRLSLCLTITVRVLPKWGIVSTKAH
jgi:hypothetical protein